MAITKISPSVVDFDAGITISTTDNTSNLILTSTDADGNTGPVLELYRNSSSPADNDELGRIYFYGENDNDEKMEYGLIRGTIVDASDGTEDSALQIYTYSGGGQRNRIDLLAGETVFNEGSQDLDFRVESDGNTHALFVQGSDGFVGINRTPANILDIEFADGSNVTAGNIADNSVTGINMINTTNSNGAGTHIKMMANNGNNMTAIAHEQVATNSSQLLFYTENAGTFAQKLRINEAGTMFSAAGIAFGGDTAAANQLDDYEEGTWTPDAHQGTASFTTVHSATYVKIGNMCYCQAYIVFPASSDTGYAAMSLPFNAANITNAHWGGPIVLANHGLDFTSCMTFSNSHDVFFRNYKTGVVATRAEMSGKYMIVVTTFQTT